MFRPGYRHKHHPFTDPIDWTDYRWDSSPWRGPVPATPWGHARPRGYGFARLLLAGLAVFATLKLVNSFRVNNGSWARRGLFAVLLLIAANAFANRSRRW